ncbi:MAG: hypothetical protein HYX29_08315 [Solirubrobacterales bacterium]|nr:hypothetical protein [Solirubrobacterales bacterium]
MATEDTTPARDPDVRKRRLVLYAAALLALLLVAGFAGRTLLSGDDNPEVVPKVLTPVIIERIQLKPIGGSSGRGLAEVLRRGSAESMRVLAARLKPSTEKQIYQLVLTGGQPEDKLLGNSAIGSERIFVGEAKLTVAELQKYRRVELRVIINGAPPSEKTVLRGTIPR